LKGLHLLRDCELHTDTGKDDDVLRSSKSSADYRLEEGFLSGTDTASGTAYVWFNNFVGLRSLLPVILRAFYVLSRGLQRMAGQYNLKNPGVKRILQEVKEMQKAESSEFIAEPLEDNIFEWHFAIRGPADTEFEGGIYSGRIVLPAEYPFKPPAFMFLTVSSCFFSNA
jgi:hypothetical protein